MAAHLTKPELELMFHSARNFLAPDIVNEDTLTYVLATKVIGFFFGDKWLHENVHLLSEAPPKKPASGREYLLADYDSGDDELRHIDRVWRLAEHVFNMQSVGGMEWRGESR